MPETPFAIDCIRHGDCLDLMREMPNDLVDLVMDSPPYSDARTYGIGFCLKGQTWVDWMFERTMEALRVCKGPVCTVIEARTQGFAWGAEPALLMADLHRAGVTLRKPPVFHRVGVPGSGGPDWLRNDYEFVVVCTRGRKLPFSDNTAMGHPPRWAPGGEMSNRLTNGARVNQWGHPIDSGATVVDPAGVITSKGKRPSHVLGHATGGEGRKQNGQHKTRAKRVADGEGKICTSGGERGDAGEEQNYLPPVLANPGNAIRQTYTADEVTELLAEASDVTHHMVGGGVMGSRLCHENEAPYPESLAEFFIRSFCPPGGIVLDRFCGSGTTPAVAKALGRRYIGFDVRQSQVELARKRLANVTPPLFAK